MNCTDVKENLYDYATGRLEKGLRPAVESHLHSCPSCTAKLTEIKETISLLDTVKPPRVPDYEKREAFNRLFKKPAIKPDYDVSRIANTGIKYQIAFGNESKISREPLIETKKPEREINKRDTSITFTNITNIFWIVIYIALFLLIIFSYLK